MSLVAIIDAAGITAPSFAEIYAELQATFKGIYGTDSYLDPDSQDGQLLAVFAKSLHDANQTAVAAYYSFSPASAVGEALSNNVRINNITRKVPTHSQVQVSLVGVANSQIFNGIIADDAGVKWALPAVVTIASSGLAVVMATAIEPGSFKASPKQVSHIVTPAKGWQSVTNYVPAIPGAPVESDGELRQRQALSTANPSQSVTKGISGAVAAVPGVVRSRVYENDTGAANADGHPAHSISVVALGGDPTEIATTIMNRKTPGAYTHGDTPVSLLQDGWPQVIRFFSAQQTPVRVHLYITPLPGYLAGTEEAIKDSVASYINNLGIGRKVDQGRLFLPAQFFGDGPLAGTFEVNSILLTDHPSNTPVNADLAIAFNALAVTDPETDILIFTP